jgi:hypothetical protein
LGNGLRLASSFKPIETERRRKGEEMRVVRVILQRSFQRSSWKPSSSCNKAFSAPEVVP